MHADPFQSFPADPDVAREEALAAGGLPEIAGTEAPWHSRTTIRAGLGREFFWRPASVEEVRRLVLFARSRGLDIWPVGQGSNLVGSDRDHAVAALDLRGMAAGDGIRPVSGDPGRCRVSAAVPLPVLASSLVDRGRGGLARLSGIPASLGGALRMNAGALGACIGDFVLRIDGLHLTTGRDFRMDCRQEQWSYRHSPVPEDVLILEAEMAFPESSPEEERTLLLQERLRRRSVTPEGLSAGSVFRNPPGAPPAGRLLEEAGCKELPPSGPFSVSRRHANWIVNLSGKPGSAADCLRLLRRMRLLVRRRFGIDLAPEWRIVP